MSNRKKLYEALVKDYDMGTFEQFKKDIQDDTKRRKLYDAIIDDYDMGSYEQFSSQVLEGLNVAADGSVRVASDNSTSDGRVVVDEDEQEMRDARKAYYDEIGYEDALERAKQDKKKEGRAAFFKSLLAAGAAAEGPMYSPTAADDVMAHVRERRDARADVRTLNEAIEGAEEGLDVDAMAQSVGAPAVAEVQHRAEVRERMQEDGTIDRMKEMRKEARKEKRQARRAAMASAAMLAEGFAPMGTDERVMEQSREWAQNKLMAQTLDEALDKADAGEIDGVGKEVRQGLNAFWDSASRAATWDFGASDALNGVTLYSIIKKWEEDPESLTATEQKVLDALGMATAVEEAYRDQLGVGYGVGESLPVSMGFMASMALNPASGFGKALARQAVRRYGRNSVKKNIVRLIGDVAEIDAMMLTTGAGRVVADAMERINGRATYDIDPETGMIEYGGQKDQVAVADAFLKAIVSNYIENYTETIGNYMNFDPLYGMMKGVAAKGLRKMNLNKWADALTDVSPAAMTSKMRGFKEMVKFDGVLGEIMEEEIGMAMNALFVGDNKWSDFLDAETQLTTIMSCTIMSAVLNGYGGYQQGRVRRQYEKNVEDREREAQRLLGDKFADLRDRIDLNSPEGVVDALNEVYQSQDYTLEQKRALANYASARVGMQYYNESEAKARRGLLKEEQQWRDAYEAGRAAQLPAYYNIDREYRAAEAAINERENAEEMWDAIAAINRAPAGEVENILNGFSEEDKQLINNWRYNAARWSGAINHRAEQVQDLVDEYAGRVTPYVQPDGTVTTAIYGDRVVYVSNRTEKTATIWTHDGARKEMVPIGELEHVQTHNAEELIERFRNEVTPAVEEETDRYMEYPAEVQEPAVGVEVQADGKSWIVTAVNGDEVMVAKMNVANESPKPMTREEFMDWQLAELERKEANTYEQGEALTFYVNGTPVGAEVRAVTPDGEYEVQIERPMDGLNKAVVDTYTAEELRALTQRQEELPQRDEAAVDNVAETAENEGTPVGEIEQDVSEEVANSQIGENVTEPIAEVAEDVNTPQAKAAELLAELEEDEVDENVSYNAQKALDAAEKTRKAKPTMKDADGDVAAFKALKSQWQAELDEAQREVLFWDNVAKEVQRQREARMSEQVGMPAQDPVAVEAPSVSPIAEAAPVAKPKRAKRQRQTVSFDEFGDVAMDAANEILQDRTPQNGEELVAWMLTGPKGIKLIPESFRDYTGYSKSEQRKLFQIMAKKENGGVTMERFGELVMLADREDGTNFFDQSDANAGLNAVLELLSQVETIGDINNYIYRNREEMAYREASAVQAAEDAAMQEAKDAWYMEQYHATEEELAAYNEYLAEFAEEIYGEDADYEQRIATFAEIQLEYDNQGKDAGLRSSADQGEGLASDREGGRSVGETEQLDRREVLADADRVAEAEDGRAGGSVSAQSDDRQARIDRAVREYRDNVDNSPEGIANAERDWQRYQENLAEDAAETVETLENGDVRRTNRNSNGEIATVAIERDGNVISVDTYEDGALFERTDYDANGNATKVTRYKNGEVVSEQEYKDGKRKVTANYFEIAEEAQRKRAQEGKRNEISRHQEGKRRRKESKDKALARQIGAYSAGAIAEFEKKTGWTKGLTAEELAVVDELRSLSDNDIRTLQNELFQEELEGKKRDGSDAIVSALKKYARSGERLYLLSRTGIIVNEPVELYRVVDLFNEYNDDTELAILMRSILPIIQRINPKITFEIIREDGQVEDRVLGEYVLRDNHIRFNLHTLNSSRRTDQEKANTIVHEMLHAVVQYAIDAKIRKNEGEDVGIDLSPQLERAAQMMLDVYTDIRNNPIFRYEVINEDKSVSIERDYGIKSVHEMISELSNPEFREKLKRIELPIVEGGKVRNAWQGLLDAITRFFRGYANSSVYRRTRNALEMLIDSFDEVSYTQARAYSSGKKLSAEENLRFRNDNNAELKEKYTDEQIFDAAKQRFGVTDDIREAGYILPDGSMLDFSGRYAVDGDASHLKGGRHMDHREVNQIAYDANDNETGLETNMTDFIERGAIRIHYSNSGVGVINLNIAPTKEQKAKLRQLISAHNGNMDVDFGNGWNTEHHAEYDKAKPTRILGDIDRYYSEGVRPEGNILYRDGAPFFSNAERAVENIKQQKATPEQWLAMIKKDGGLKAGEDKWMGLSDWLNEQKEKGVKTLTKDEVLAFIRENQIEIEEVEYDGEREMFTDADIYETDEFTDMLNNLVGFDEEDNQYVNRELFDEYANSDPDFFDAFTLDYWGESIDVRDPQAAARYLGLTKVRKPINSTRLDYTTEGLDNKKEIALVVPTIEPWNQSDTIHFGDAGEGRAVAWVRFGETTDEDGNRVLVIDEVQSKRHDEGRAKGYKQGVPSRTEAYRKLQDIESSLANKYGDEFYDLESDEEIKGFVGEEDFEVYASIRDEYIEVRRFARENNSRVPDAPFDKNYHELVMKRMLRYAAENGFDKVAWTKGKQQAMRYRLGSVVESVQVTPYEANSSSESDGYDIDIYTSGGLMSIFSTRDGEVSGEMNGEDITGRRLSDVLGKELSEKILNTDMNNGRTNYSGNDLIIGGEDRNALYDEMIPRFMNKYVKKWGTKVGEVSLPNVEEAGRTMWSVDVTPEMRESVMQGQPMFREGMGAVSDREVSYENDPIAKWQGKPRYYGKRAAAFAERERRRMAQAAEATAKTLGLDVEVVTDAATASQLTQQRMKRRPKAKGWYDVETGKIVVVVPNHVSAGDAVRTVLHEGVAHHGLRELFGDGFDAMLDNIYNNVAPELKARIDAIAERTGVSTQVATEEYLASLAEDTNFEYAKRTGWWTKIKGYFMKMLRKLGMPGLTLREEIADNELRYLLWRSYQNLVDPNSYLKPLGYLDDVAKQKELKVGEYAENTMATPRAADIDAIEDIDDIEDAEAEEWAEVTMQRIEELEAQAVQLENEIADMEADRDADDASRYEMWEQQIDPLREQLDDVYAEIEGLYSLEAEAEEMSMASEDAIRYRLVDDQAEIERLESEPTIKAYRAMQVINGELYPPMSAVVDGKLREPIALGQWEQSEERPDLADDNGRFKLDKGNKKSLKAAYNPYFHSSSTPLNDQFSEAQDRDNLVTVEVEVPVSEADGTSGYKAEKAKDAVGTHQWKAGIIQGQLTGTREVFLTRWDKPVRIVPESEVADVIVEMFDGKDIVMPSNVVTPQLRKELEARGITFVETDNQGKLVEGEHKGEHYSKVYGKKSTNKSKKKAEIIAEVERESGALGVPVRIARSVDELPDEDTRKRAVDGKLKGYYDPRTNEVVLYAPNTDDANDAKRTILHEIVGHKGLRQLIGEERYDKAMVQLMYMLPSEVRDAVLRRAERHGWNAAIAMDEHLAEQAERDVQPTWWGKVNAKIRAILRNLGFDVKLTDADVTYLLWRSRKKLQGDTAFDMATDAILKQAARKSVDYEAIEERAIRYRGAEEGRSMSEKITEYYEKYAATTNAKHFWGGLVHSIGHIFDGGTRRFLNDLSEKWLENIRTVRRLEEGIEKAEGKPLKPNEMVHKSLNAEGSISAREMEVSNMRFFEPLSKLIGKILGTKMEDADGKRRKIEIDDIERYLICKHARENNAFLMKRAHAENKRKTIDERAKELMKGSMTEEEAMIQAASEYTLHQTDFRDDYSGLTELFAGRGENLTIDDLERMADEEVARFEAAIGNRNTIVLWRIINGINMDTIEKSFEKGLISRSLYNDLKKRHKYYVPLVGYKSDYAPDIYSYTTKGMDLAPLQSVVKKAFGTKHQARNVIGAMFVMNTCAITQGNHNVTKQKLYNLALNHDTGVLQVVDIWEVKDGNEWVLAAPPVITENMTQREVQNALIDYNKRMRELKENGDARQAKNTMSENFGLNIEEKDMENHYIKLLVNGREVVLWVNGNPKLAQAINGLLDKKFTFESAGAKAIDMVVQGLNRFMAQTQTSLNPEFLVGNVQRDILTATESNLVQYGVKYQAKFTKYYSQLWPVGALTSKDMRDRFGTSALGIWRLFALDRNTNDHDRDVDTPILDMNNRMHREFVNFLNYGGKTGYVELRQAEDIQTRIKRLGRRERSVMNRLMLKCPAEVVEGLLNGVEKLNEGAENAARFAAYLTMRDMGKSVTEAIYEAKEVTVNFNMHGSGDWGNAIFRYLYNYFNVALQALRKEKVKFVASPAKATMAKTMLIGAGALQALLLYTLCAGDDDDENEYMAMSDWNRWNYFNSRVTINKGEENEHEGFIHWSIPQDQRAFFATGAILYEMSQGLITEEHGWRSIISQVNNYTPLEVVSSVNSVEPDKSFIGDLAESFVPSLLQPVYEAYGINEDFLGRPIHNKNEWNAFEPEWQRAGYRTPELAVNISKGISEATGGDDHLRGKIEVNPSQVFHVLKGFGGGTASFVEKCIALGELVVKDEEQLAAEGKEIELRDLPFVSKLFVETGDDYSQQRMVNERYDMYEVTYKTVKNRLDGAERDAKKAFAELGTELKNKAITQQEYDERWAKIQTDLADKKTEIENSDKSDYEIYLIYASYKSDMNQLKRLLGNAYDGKDYEEVDQLKEGIFATKKIVVDNIMKMLEESSEIMSAAEK